MERKRRTAGHPSRITFAQASTMCLGWGAAFAGFAAWQQLQQITVSWGSCLTSALHCRCAGAFLHRVALRLSGRGRLGGQ
jgi:hypothetical protein